MPNVLAEALSPYLRQHADNPVDWQQWGPEPFAEAARRDVPVFVSIGYSTCHWCHVMARESFSDPAIARLLNANFVSIKVDREEHPEVDAGYLAAASAFTPNLGWPLNVFVTPAGQAFFAGTYWPPDAMAGHPSFRQVLDGVTDAWANRRAEVESNAADVAAAIRGHAAHPAAALPDRAELDKVVDLLAANEDRQFGGFGSAPKFPVVPVLDFLLEHGSPESIALADRTLTAIADSGLRDRVEGGFFRYATRRDWTEPHYERMLYDNAGLLRAYSLLAVQVPERADLAREAAEGIVSFLMRTMRLPGGFASAQNSESFVDGYLTEGDYYSLSAEDRAAQPDPALDEKVLTGWNGLAIGALASAGHRFGRDDWLDAARDAATTILASQVKESGELVRATLAGNPSAARATLEDYGLLARGLLQLAQATGELRWAGEARRLVDACTTDEGFAIPGGGDPTLAGFGIDAGVDPTEGALPSGTSALAEASYLLYLLRGEREYLRQSGRAMERLAGPAVRQPLGFGSALAVMSALASPVTQLVVVTDDPDAALADAARGWFEAGGVSVTVSASGAAEWSDAGFELFEGRSLHDGLPTAYLCSDFVCRLPVTDVSGLVGLGMRAEP
ncbi:thioredoxin domain-containing protein [Leifsonia bigeumensis]|uniref:Thioredoxin domain-containing protein n=1 Tax=Leifsonella bigeumensis TaxID=433643 RepID=A0ABP7FGD5_9MICO